MIEARLLVEKLIMDDNKTKKKNAHIKVKPICLSTRTGLGYCDNIFNFSYESRCPWNVLVVFLGDHRSTEYEEKLIFIKKRKEKRVRISPLKYFIDTRAIPIRTNPRRTPNNYNN